MAREGSIIAAGALQGVALLAVTVGAFASVAWFDVVKRFRTPR